MEISLPAHTSSPLPAAPTASFPYRVTGLVGEGAMGEVYRAQDIELGRLIAIKVIKPAFLAALSERDADQAIRRFTQEARAAAALSHPGVTVVHRVGTENGWPYIAMEWLEGQSLEDVLARQGRIPVDQAARLGLQVLAALDAAHAAGIVHRDIKPGNLMITKARRVKVMDFGVARVQSSELAQTQVGHVVGTPQYAAPEQLAGQAIDARVDLYALGAALYEAVVGRPPFDSANLYELIHAVQTQLPTPASQVVRSVPPAFDAFLARALAKQPGDRFADAREMARALQGFTASRETAGGESGHGTASASQVRLAPAPGGVVPVGSPAQMVAALVDTWTRRALGRQETSRVLDRLLERPLHADAFSGALRLEGSVLLVYDGILFGALSLERPGEHADLVIARLPAQADATLYPSPPGLNPRVVLLLASLLSPRVARLSDLDAGFVDVRQLVERLSGEGFDGVVHISHAQHTGFSLFSKGQRVFDLIGSGQAQPMPLEGWDASLLVPGARINVEERSDLVPAMTFRRELREFHVDVLRPQDDSDPSASMRVDTHKSNQATELVIRPCPKGTQADDSIVCTLARADPIFDLARWWLVDARHQFEQFRRTSRWKAMLEPMSEVQHVVMHHTVALASGRSVEFDAMTCGADGQPHHVLDRIADGTPQAVLEFVARVTAAKSEAGPTRGLGGAILVAPVFSDAALEAYLGALKDSRKAGLRSMLDLLSHREGFVMTPNGGVHVLLVEEQEGRRRPLVPQN